MLTMRLPDVQFALIASGKKTVETRLNDAKRQSVRVGDVITFINRENAATLPVKITAMHHFDTFEEALDTLDHHLGNSKAQVLADLHVYYPADEIASHGVVSFVFEVA
jgi:ASC-1-like (ASCH) protein